MSDEGHVLSSMACVNEKRMFVMSDEGHLLSGTACVNENVYLLCHMKAVCFQVRPLSMKHIFLCHMKAVCFQVRPVSMKTYVCYQRKRQFDLGFILMLSVHVCNDHDFTRHSFFYTKYRLTNSYQDCQFCVNQNVSHDS